MEKISDVCCVCVCLSVCLCVPMSCMCVLCLCLCLCVYGVGVGVDVTVLIYWKLLDNRVATCFWEAYGRHCHKTIARINTLLL